VCFNHDSHPPIRALAGASIEHHHLELTATDGNRFAAFRAVAAQPTGAAMMVLPDVRGLFGYYEELALRFAEIGVDALAIDYFGRTAGVSGRDADFEYMPHVERTTWSGLQADAMAAASELRSSADVRSLYSVGFCFGGRTSFLLGTVPGLDMAGVIGFYGWPVDQGRNDTPAPIDVVDQMKAPVLGLFGGADRGISGASVKAFEVALAGAGVPHRIVTYEGAPHSFFDRQQDAFADASEQAWAEVREFIGGPPSDRR
jgi:carboxymethylenebutenolidase